MIEKKIIINRYGSWNELNIAQEDKTYCTAVKVNEIKIRINGFSVNAIDCKIRRGEMKIITGNRFPKILGADFSGKIVEVGSDVKKYKKGDEVFGLVDPLKGGAYQEFITVTENNIAMKPENISYSEAAGLSLVGMTSIQAMLGHGKMKNGMKVLVIGASGGVGTVATQLAKNYGCIVHGICAQRNFERIYELGASKLYDYKTMNLNDLEEDYDIIFDTVGVLSFKEVSIYRSKLSDNGTMITTGQHFLSQWTSSLFKKKFKCVIVKPNKDDQELLKRLIESIDIIPIIDAVFAFENVHLAHKHFENHKKLGKVVVFN